MQRKVIPWLRSKGITFLGFLMLCIIIGPYFKLLLDLWTPVNNDLTIRDIFQDMVSDPKINSMPKDQVELKIFRRMSVNGVQGFDKKIHFSMKKDGKNGVKVWMYKEEKIPFWRHNMFILYIVDHSFHIKPKSGS